VTLPVIVLRPEPGLGRTLDAARAMGLVAVAAPLFEITPVAWEVPDPIDFDAIIAGSANAFRHGGAGLDRLKSLPVYAVGEKTARVAREMGFTVASVGEGGLQSLLGAITPPVSLLRLAGKARVPLETLTGVSITERVVYRAMPLPLRADAVEALGKGAVALLHSAEAASRFAEECDRLEVDRGQVSLAALGARIAAAAGHGWRTVAAADRPADDRLLAIARTMCQ
jgi:uroporphyrinogen-III synthase